jgi:threonine/homoserine/homoserine lactone efflux protein
MIDTSLYAAFLVAAFALCVTPGPDMMFIVAVGGRGGPLTGMTAALGVACAMFVHAVAAALGLSALFLTLPALYDALRWAGAAYLLFLAVRAFRGEAEPAGAGPTGAGPAPDKGAAPKAGAPRRRAFWRGAVTNLLNPKVILFNVSFLPQFVNPALGHVREQFLLLGCTITLMGLLVDGSVGLLSGRLAALLRRSRRVARGLDYFSGTVFAGLALRLATTLK